MQFASVLYVIFLTVTVAVYFALPGPRSRTLWLLAASYVFYYSLSTAWTGVLLAVTAIGYLAGLAMPRRDGDGSPMPPRAKAVLIASVVSVVGILAVFKYAAFGGSLLNAALSAAGSSAQVPLLRLVLPVGISFWTFQTIAYLVDVARGKRAAERSLPRYALFIAFFPHVTAGPIARAGQLLPQLEQKRQFSFEGARSGLQLMLWGFFKKLVVADALAIVVAGVFDHPHAFGGNALVIAAACVAFSVQIYCDFSGYTDIARGTARIFGIELLRNFDRPYASRSIKEFWRRWHMSLMSWLREYIYFPLGGSRVAKPRRYLNILIVFAVSGLWHGAGLTYIAWGLLNGAYQIVGEWLAPARARLVSLLRIAEDGRVRHALQIAITFTLVTVGWIFFRANSLADAGYMLSHLLSRSLLDLHGAVTAITGLGLSKRVLEVTAAAAVLVFAVEWLATRIDLKGLIYRQPLLVRWALYQAAIVAVIVLGRYGPGLTGSDFVYFKF